MSSIGPKLPTSGTYSLQSGDGISAWANLSNALSSSDAGAYAECNMGVGSTAGQTLELRKFDFSALPDNVEIVGIEVLFRRSSQIASTVRVRDRVIKLTKEDGVADEFEEFGDAILVGDNKAETSVDWATGGTLESRTYGGASDLWGITLTPAEAKETSFGVCLAVQRTTAGFNTGIARVDYCQITLHYTEESADEGGQTRLIKKSIEAGLALGL